MVDMLLFSSEIVPRVQAVLDEEKTPQLQSVFTRHDSEGNGRLQMMEFVASLEDYFEDILSSLWGVRVQETPDMLFWDSFAPKLADMAKLHCFDDGTMGFYGFKHFVREMEDQYKVFMNRLELRTAKVADISPAVVDIFGVDIVFFRGIYDSYILPLDGEELPGDRVLMALMDCGAISNCGKLLQHAFNAMYGETYRFSDFLKLVMSYRRQERKGREVLFDIENNDDKSYSVQLHNVPQLLVSLGMLSDCLTRPEEVSHLLDKYCPALDHELHAEELLDVSGKLIERARTTARNEEHKKAQQMEIGFADLLMLRMEFAALTGSGALGEAEAAVYLTRVYPAVQVEEVMALVSQYGNEKRVAAGQSKLSKRQIKEMFEIKASLTFDALPKKEDGSPREQFPPEKLDSSPKTSPKEAKSPSRYRERPTDKFLFVECLGLLDKLTENL
eukprot:TRINITY_DN37192_c0_g2_i1.p1 TRINITY_DN37192_c0_g2~~TRINITY_DN37192_c0_g2_i1.p1  ORF type:complete len:496 (-),score=76.09 TRINITY_DN37192_c0_g2_i1:182-1516(-)